MKTRSIPFIVLIVLAVSCLTLSNSRKAVAFVAGELTPTEIEAQERLRAYENTGDPNCPKAVKNGTDSGIAYICGHVKKDRLEREDPNDLKSPYIKPYIKGASVVVYQQINTPSGKSVDPQNWGLTNPLPTIGVTDENGHFAIPIAIQGPADHTVYPVVFCGSGKFVDMKMRKTFYSSSDVYEVNCPKDSTPITTAPGTLNYVKDRNTYLSCDTPGISNTAEPTSANYGLTQSKYVGFDLVEEIATDANLYEKDFDTRYSKTNGGIINVLEKTDGAWWAYDCVVRKNFGKENELRGLPGLPYSGEKELTCYTNTDIPDVGSEPGLDTIVDLSSLSDGNTQKYLVANTLDTLPFSSTMPAYRRYEHRVNSTRFIQNPTAPQSFMQTMFGGAVGYVSFEGDTLVSCENFKNANSTLGDGLGGIMNSYTTSGPGLALSHPYGEYLDMYNKLCTSYVGNESNANHPFNFEVCQGPAGAVTYKQIEPPTDWVLKESCPTEYALDSDYFRKEYLLPSGSGAVASTFDSKYSSVTDQGGIRIGPFALGENEAESQAKTGSKVVIPEGSNNTNSVVTGLALSEKDEEGTGGSLLSMLESPYTEGYTYDTGNTTVDFGANSQSFCSASLMNTTDTNVPADLTDNVFGDQVNNTATPMAQRQNKTASTQIYLTAQAMARDKLYGENSAYYNQSWYDSNLSLFEADEEKSNGSLPDFIASVVGGLRLHGDNGPNKSFYQQTTYNGSVKTVPLNVDYPLSAENFGSFFTQWGEGDGHPDYPWHDVAEGDRCYSWGNQYYTAGGDHGIDTCDGDRNCLRTCRLSPNDVTEDGITFKGCVLVTSVQSCEWDEVGDDCDCGPVRLVATPCETPDSKAAQLRGETTMEKPDDPNPPDDDTIRCNCQGTCDDGDGEDWDGGSELWASLQSAGPYEGEAIDLDTGLAKHFRMLQVPLKGSQESLDAILYAGNSMAGALQDPYAGNKSWELGASLDTDSTKSKTDERLGWGKNTTGLGGAGVTEALLSTTADPVFGEPSEDEITSVGISYNPGDTPLVGPKLLAGPA
ncbi:MAG: hypothetical protein ACD_22C00044G0001, partial [uncultured bacterium]